MEFTYEQYVDDVLAGRVVVGRHVRLAVERHVRDLERAEQGGPYYFDHKAAQMPILLAAMLRHWKGKWAGQPILLEPWQQFVLASIFGWKRRSDGLRRYRTAITSVARKNGKTLLSAVIGLYLLLLDGESGGEVYSVATKRDQARISHRDAVELVRRSDRLGKMVTIVRDNLSYEELGSKFEPLSSDAKSMDGLSPSGIIADEAHAWRDGALFDVMTSATAARSQPLVLVTSTAGFDRGFYYELEQYAITVLEGTVEDDSFFAVVFRLDEDDDPFDESLWPKANPNLGVSKSVEDMRLQAKHAQAMPARLNSYLVKHCNLFTNALTAWLPYDAWDKCGGIVDEDELVGRTCYGGLDLSSTTDLSSWSLVFPPLDAEGDGDDSRWIILSRSWAPEENVLDRSHRDGVSYEAWARAGHLELTPGNVIDYDYIRHRILADADKFDLREVAFDPWNSIQLITDLQKEGFRVSEGDHGGGPLLVQHRQGFVSMSAPMKEMERLILAGKINHGNNPLLTWAFTNVVARTDPAGNIKPDKSDRGSTGRIDPAVAAIMGLGRAVVHAGASRESAYKKRGLRTL